MKNLKRFVLMLALLAVALPSFAAEAIKPMREVRDMARVAKVVEVTDDILIEGYMVGQPYGQNNEMNVSVHYASMKNGDLETGYIESLNGDAGLRIKFAQRPMAKKFPRYAKVVVSLKGTTLRCD